MADNITLWGLDLGRGTNTRLSFDNVDHFSPTWAPRGNWVADATNIRSGGKKGTEIIRGGAEPRWGPASDELFFLGSDHKLRVVKVDLGDLEFGLPEPLFHLPAAKHGTAYDIGLDGRILVTAQFPEGGSHSFHLVQNWPRLLEKPPRCRRSGGGRPPARRTPAAAERTPSRSARWQAQTRLHRFQFRPIERETQGALDLINPRRPEGADA